MLPAAYLAKKLTQPLPIRGGPVLRTIGEAADYMLALPHGHVEANNGWRRAAQLLLDQADVAEVISKSIWRRSSTIGSTSRPWTDAP
jgi:hypothetical protein